MRRSGGRLWVQFYLKHNRTGPRADRAYFFTAIEPLHPQRGCTPDETGDGAYYADEAAERSGTRVALARKALAAKRKPYVDFLARYPSSELAAHCKRVIADINEAIAGQK